MICPIVFLQVKAAWKTNTIDKENMQNFLVIFAIVTSCVFLHSCDHSEANNTHSLNDINVDTIYSSDGETILITDTFAIDSSGLDVLFEDAGPMLEEINEPSQLPSDPTEDPDQESSYYEFPAWNVPAPPKWTQKAAGRHGLE